MQDTKEMVKKEADVQTGVERTKVRKVYTPTTDIIERKNEIVVLADMPGVDESSVDITLEKNILTIYGRIEPEVPANHKLGLSEYGIGDYQRFFNVSNEIDKDRIQASVKNGVLKLVLPKAEAAKTRKIEVMAEK